MICAGCRQEVARAGACEAEHYDMAPHDCAHYCGAATARGTACLNGERGERCSHHGGQQGSPKSRERNRRAAERRETLRRREVRRSLERLPILPVKPEDIHGWSVRNVLTLVAVATELRGLS